MSRFKPYPRYKDSGVEWLGEVPEHWDVLLGRRMFVNARDLASPDAVQLAATQAFGVIPQKDFMEIQEQKVVLALGGTDNFKGVRVDDFVISLRSFQGGIEHSAYDGCVSPAYSVLRAKSGQKFVPQYFKFLLKCTEYITALQSVTTGIREGRTITYDQFASLSLPIPPAVEQTGISKFIAFEVARIDALIAEQQRLIELLKEKRQAVISHAVTKGLDPTVPMQDSGVEWLGQVPAHWSKTRLGHVANILTGFPFPSASFSQDEHDMRLLRGANVGIGTLKWDDTVYWPQESVDDYKQYLLEAGQIVIGMDRPWISEGLRMARVKESDLPCLLLQRVAMIWTNEKLDDAYLFALLSSNLFKAFVEPDLTGVSVPHISPEQILSFVVPLPPIEDQREIVAYIQEQEKMFASIRSESLAATKYLQEYRSALISDAVTGKIDLRHWQPPITATPSEATHG